MSNSLWPRGLQHTRLPILHCLPEFAQLLSIELMMPANYLILCHPLLLLASIFPSIRVFPNVSVLLIRWPKYWSFIFSISPSNWYSGLISFRIDRLDLPVVQGTLKSLIQHHSWKASIFWHSAFFTSNSQNLLTHVHWVSDAIQLSHPLLSPSNPALNLSQQQGLFQWVSSLHQMVKV